ncbi:MAG: RNA 2',3'-cyclic phosphodiesterase [bacterium]
MTTETLRCFIAISLPLPLRERLVRAQELCARSHVRVSWVSPENLHLTLAFLGYIVEATLDPLRTGLDQVTAGVRPFRMKVAGAGTFGRPGFPRVVWAGIEGPPAELQRIHVGLTALLKGLGIPQEDRPFAPHITLGRVRESIPRRAGSRALQRKTALEGSRPREPLAALTSALASIKNDAFGDVQVGCLLIMRSHLEQPRVRYSVLHESPLRGT